MKNDKAELVDLLRYATVEAWYGARNTVMPFPMDVYEAIAERLMDAGVRVGEGTLAAPLRAALAEADALLISGRSHPSPSEVIVRAALADISDHTECRNEIVAAHDALDDLWEDRDRIMAQYRKVLDLLDDAAAERDELRAALAAPLRPGICECGPACAACGRSRSEDAAPLREALAQKGTIYEAVLLDELAQLRKAAQAVMDAWDAPAINPAELWSIVNEVMPALRAVLTTPTHGVNT